MSDDGSFRVVKQQILRDCGLSPVYSNQNKNIWENPEFLELLQAERRRRDTGMLSVVNDIEEAVGPLIEARVNMQKTVQDVFSRAPDAEDPLALSPDQYQKGALAWCRYIDEITGKGRGQSEEAAATIAQALLEDHKITAGMADKFVDLLGQYREQQDRMLQSAGIIEGELE